MGFLSDSLHTRKCRLGWATGNGYVHDDPYQSQDVDDEQLTRYMLASVEWKSSMESTIQNRQLYPY